MAAVEESTADVNRWRCPECPFIVWAPDGEAVVDELATHLSTHYERKTQETVFRTEWTCPHCESRLTAPDPEQLVERIKSHMVEHERSRILAGASMGCEAKGTKTFLTLASDSCPVNFARIHHASECDAMVFVTADPIARLRLARRFLADELDRVVLVVPEAITESGIDRLDADVFPFDIEIERPAVGLDHLWQAIVDGAHGPSDDRDQQLIDFDLFDWVLQTGSGYRSFQFMHMLVGLIDMNDWIGHFSLDPDRYPMPTIRTYAPMFDIAVAARSDRLVSVITEPCQTVAAASETRRSDPSTNGQAH